jgi:hypothetical protein
VCPVVESILHDEEDGDLQEHGPDIREGDTDFQAKVVDYGVEQVYLREFDREVLQ